MSHKSFEPESTFILEDLRRRFEILRTQQKRTWKIPEDLRLAVLNAIAANVPKKHIQHVCALYGNQLKRWEELQKQPLVSAPRFLNIVDVPQATTTTAFDMRLKMRIGRWCFNLSQIDSLAD